MREYFRLLGLNCSKKLRKNLDTAFYPADRRDNERYALFRKKEDGDCPLRLNDGLCGLQKECGEGILPSVCRYYPRAVRGGYAYECSCSGSCEKVIEMLFARENKLNFEERLLAFDLNTDFKDTLKKDFYISVRKDCLDILQNRDCGLPQRLRNLGVYLRALYNGNDDKVLPKHNKTSFPLSEKNQNNQGFDIIKKVSLWFEENCASLGEYGSVVESVYGEVGYDKACLDFNELFPKWEIMFENLLANHLFYERFPFSNKYEDLKESYFSLCGVYAFLRYMGIGYTFANQSLDSLTDVVAAAFRVIEHSGFDKNVAILLYSEGINTLEDLDELIDV